MYGWLSAEFKPVKSSALAPTGKPCLVLHGYAKAQTINPNIFEHRIAATNSCGQNIKVKVCYHRRTLHHDGRAPLGQEGFSAGDLSRFEGL